VEEPPVVEQRCNLINGHRAADVEPLHHIAAELAEEVQLFARLHTFRNDTEDIDCVRVLMNSPGCGPMQVVGYTGSFDPDNLCKNASAAIRTGPDPIGIFTFSVLPHESYVIVVSEVNVYGLLAQMGRGMIQDVRSWMVAVRRARAGAWRTRLLA